MTPSSLFAPVSGLEMLTQLETADQRRAAASDCVHRIRQFDKQLGSMSSLLSAERAGDIAVAAQGPLKGVPVAVKDIFDTHDLPTNYGSPLYAGHQPRSDAAIVTLLRRAGATVVGKSVSCEFAFMQPAATRNPFDLQRTAGGSSVGSAAAVGAGLVPFAIGSQTGGSTIRPASFCGISGFMPTRGLLPTEGMKCFSWSFDTIGLFASTVADVAFLAQTLAGIRFDTTPVSKPVFGVPVAYPWAELSPDAKCAMDTTVEAITRSGGSVRPIRFEDWMGQLTDAHAVIQSFESYRALGFEYDYHRSSLSDMLGNFLDRAALVSPQDYQRAMAHAALARQRLPALFDGVDVLLTPSTPGEAPKGFSSTGDPCFNRNWTLLGTPCLSVPGLLGSDGCPLGVQVVGLPGEDSKAVAAAAFVEQALGKALRK